MSEKSPVYLTPLDHEALLQVSGPDAARFLQGQVTCDLRQAGQGRALPGAYCTPQGRVVCDFLLGETADEQLSLRMRRDLLPMASETFGKYIVFSRADLACAGPDWQLLGCWGNGAGALLAGHFGALPGARYDAVTHEAGLLIQLDETGERFELWLRGDAGASLGAELRSATEPASAAAWIALDTAGAIARVEAATSGEFVPQMLNYDLTGHVSFSKGCYTGQEVVARLHYRGTPKRRLYPLQAAGETAPAAGTPVYGTGEQSIGAIVNAVSEGGKLAACAVVTVTQADQPLHLGAPDGPAVTVVPPPYPLQPTKD